MRDRASQSAQSLGLGPIPRSCADVTTGGISRFWAPTRVHPLHRAPVGQGPPGPDWLATALEFWSGRALATGMAWAAGLCLIHHHQHPHGCTKKLSENDNAELVTKMTQETQSFPNLVQADPRGGATFPSAARGRMATSVSATELTKSFPSAIAGCVCADPDHDPDPVGSGSNGLGPESAIYEFQVKRLFSF